MATSSFSKAVRFLRENGIGPFLSKSFNKLTRPLVQYWYTDHVWEGKIVEWTGNKSRINGVTISLDNPFIATQNKGALWKGIYEEQERRLLFRHFPRNLPVIELGASIGVLSCVTNRRLISPDRHIVVEANPQLIPTLEKNRELNSCQFKIVNAAAAYGAEQVTFYLNDKFMTGSLERKTSESITVPTCSIQSLAQADGIDRFNLICDIEGTEIDLVKHEIAYMLTHVCWFLVEKHPKIVGAKQIDEMDARLREGGFELIDTLRHVACYRNTGLDC